MERKHFWHEKKVLSKQLVFIFGGRFIENKDKDKEKAFQSCFGFALVKFKWEIKWVDREMKPERFLSYSTRVHISAGQKMV